MNTKQTFWLGILAWALYISARTLIQHLVPITDFASSVRQDEIITIFRLLCGLAVCFLYARRWTLKDLFRWERMGIWVWLGGTLLYASHLANALAFQRPAWFDNRIIAIDLVVAFNEEVGFRGLFQRALTEIKSAVWGEWLGAAMFTAMHLGYAPWSELPYIFLWGLGAGLWRSRGASIGFLILIHWLSDSTYVACWRQAAEPWPWMAWVRMACLAGVVGMAYFVNRRGEVLATGARPQ